MAKQEKNNMFGSFGAAVTEREQEQKRIEAEVTGRSALEPAAEATAEPAEPVPKSAARPKTRSVGRPRKRVDATCMTISISQADKDLVKEYAFAHAVTVSDLIHRWIQETCRDE